ncbi:hypothetical protein [Oceanithermus sp.]
MKVLICDSTDVDELRRLARRLPHPYRILRGENGYRLLLESFPDGSADLLGNLGSACRIWELVEEGCREAGDA